MKARQRLKNYSLISKTTLLSVVFLSLLFACVVDDSEYYYTGYIPRFSVDPLPDSAAVVSSTHPLRLRPVLMSLLVPTAVAQSTDAEDEEEQCLRENPDTPEICRREVDECSKDGGAWFCRKISCDRQLSAMNSTSGFAFGEILDNTPLELMESFYARAIFYDCNARQQAQEDGVGRSTQVDEAGTPDDPSDDVTKVVLTASLIGSNPEDRTRFVAWTDTPDQPNLMGLLVNKRLQQDGKRTKLRVDLKRTNYRKQVWAVLHIDYSGSSNPDDIRMMTSYEKSVFREIDSDGDGRIDQHYVSGRYWDALINTLVVVKAQTQVGMGAVVYTRRCAASSLGASCTPTTTTYYNSSGIEIDEKNHGIDRVPMSQLPSVSSFFSGSQASFFTPRFDVNLDTSSL